MATLQNRPPFLMNTAVSANCRAKFLSSPSKLRSFCASSVDLNNTHELFHGRNCRNGPISDGFKVRVKVSDSQLKENWLDSLSCPFVEKGLLPLSPRAPQSGDGEEPAITTGCEWVLGIDPDLSGALAVLKDGDSGCSAQVFDTPRLQVLIGKRIRRRLDAKSTVHLLRSFGAPLGTTAYIEQSIPYPQDGKQGWWGGGFGYGLWIGILVASGFSVVPVPALLWKNQFKLSGTLTSKDDSRKAASEMFPSLSSLLKRKKDHGRAEALLIAAYGKGLRRQQEECGM